MFCKTTQKTTTKQRQKTNLKIFMVIWYMSFKIIILTTVTCDSNCFFEKKPHSKHAYSELACLMYFFYKFNLIFIISIQFSVVTFSDVSYITIKAHGEGIFDIFKCIRTMIYFDVIFFFQFQFKKSQNIPVNEIIVDQFCHKVVNNP